MIDWIDRVARRMAGGTERRREKDRCGRRTVAEDGPAAGDAAGGRRHRGRRETDRWRETIDWIDRVARRMAGGTERRREKPGRRTGGGEDGPAAGEARKTDRRRETDRRWRSNLVCCIKWPAHIMSTH